MLRKATALAVFAAFVAGSAGAASFPELEQQVLEGTNQLRTQPKSFLPDLTKLKGEFNGNDLNLPGNFTLTTAEGVVAVDDAIAYLNSTTAVGALTSNQPLQTVARDLQEDQAKTGGTGHVGSDQAPPQERVRRHAVFASTWGENLSYGVYSGNTGRDVVIQWLVDDGVPTRGHRANLMKGEFKVTGIACGTHPTFQTECVMDFADAATAP